MACLCRRSAHDLAVPSSGALRRGDGSLFCARRAAFGARGSFAAGAARPSDRSLERTEQILALCQEKNIRILTLHDAAYPDRLRQIADPPLVLYVRGNLPFLDELPTIAIVGTRKASAYGSMWRPASGRRLLLTAAVLLPAWRSAWTAPPPGARCSRASRASVCWVRRSTSIILRPIHCLSTM